MFLCHYWFLVSSLSQLTFTRIENLYLLVVIIFLFSCFFSPDCIKILGLLFVMSAMYYIIYCVPLVVCSVKLPCSTSAIFSWSAITFASCFNLSSNRSTFSCAAFIFLHALICLRQFFYFLLQNGDGLTVFHEHSQLV